MYGICGGIKFTSLKKDLHYVKKEICHFHHYSYSMFCWVSVYLSKLSEKPYRWKSKITNPIRLHLSSPTRSENLRDG